MMDFSVRSHPGGWKGPGEVGPLGVIGLLDIGVADMSMRSVILTSSPTRSTEPFGPAQAYWPNTGLSGILSAFRAIVLLVERLELTWELVVDATIFCQQAIKLPVRRNHATFGQIHVQA